MDPKEEKPKEEKPKEEKPKEEKPKVEKKEGKPAAAAAAPSTEKKEKAPAKGEKKGEAAAPAAPAVPAVPPPPPFMGVSNRSRSGVTVKDVPAALFVTTFAKHLKRVGKITVPAWADLVKTGVGKELAPYDPDWFYIRTASIARKIYLRPCGIGDLREVYGCKIRRGSSPSRFSKGSGSVIRKCLAQLQELKLVSKSKRDGRRITATGKRELDRIAAQIMSQIKNRPIVV